MDKLLLISPNRRHTGVGEEVDEVTGGASGMGVDRIGEVRGRISLLFKKDICYCRNVSVKLLCVYVCLSSGDLFIFWYGFPLSFPIAVPAM